MNHAQEATVYINPSEKSRDGGLPVVYTDEQKLALFPRAVFEWQVWLFRFPKKNTFFRRFIKEFFSVNVMIVFTL